MKISRNSLKLERNELGRWQTDIVESDARSVIHDLVHDQVDHLIVDVVETVLIG